MVLMKAAVFVLLVALVYRYNQGKNSDDLALLKDIPDTEYDYVIIGGGSAGSVMATRLSEDKESRVLLLEAGGNVDKGDNLHIPILWHLCQKTEYDWQYYTEPQTKSCMGLKDKRAFWPRGKVLGGSSMLNSMQYTRGSRFDYDEWEAAGCEGWGYKHVLPYLLKSEDIQIPELEASMYHRKGGPLAVTKGYQTQMADVFLKAGQELGYNITDYNGEDLEGFSFVQKTIRNGVRSSTNVEYLGTANGRDNLHISLNSLATKIEIIDKRAKGVSFIKDGKKRHVKARKEIVLSAGAINSPQLLLLSGIGPKKHLEQMNIPLVADLPVGENLQDHMMLLMSSDINKPYTLVDDVLTSWWTLLRYIIFGGGPLSITGSEGSAFLHLDSSKRGKSEPNIQIVFYSALIRDNIFNFNEDVEEQFIEKDRNKHGFTTAIIPTRPHSVGRVSLRSTDPYDYPILDPGYFTKRVDLETYIGGIRVWEKLTETKAFQALGVNINKMRKNICSAHKFRSDEYWECIIRHVAVTSWHHSGTCKMGAVKNPTTVVDPELKVKGIQGLRVVDASIFPNVTSGNINAPVIMVAEKAADMIRGKDTVKNIRQSLQIF